MKGRHNAQSDTVSWPSLRDSWQSLCGLAMLVHKTLSYEMLHRMAHLAGHMASLCQRQLQH